MLFRDPSRARVAHPATGGQRLNDPSCIRSVQTTMTTKACNNRRLWSAPLLLGVALKATVK
jgi:hypothetical protein